ncbi:hypothetical protein [Actinocrispum sp. NPDC049592]|uniref:hypothetical protein n=1 Tax=Actinocrispum sp. NPDC049592 TaxID=3154835 RepID=UPI00344523D2
MTRRGIAVVLTLLACLLAAPAVAAFALDQQVVDQNRYLQAVTPIADDAEVRKEIADRVAYTINTKLPDSVHEMVDSGVRKAVDSDTFHTAWATVNKAAQPQVIAMLRGEPSSLRIQDDMVMFDLGTALDQLKAQSALARYLPDVDLSVKVFSKPAIRRAIPAFSTLESLSVVLPIVVVVLLLLGLLLSGGRTLLLAGAGLALAMLALVAYQAIGRGQVGASAQSPHLAEAFYNAFTGYLDVMAWVVFGVGVALALAGLVTRARLART